MDKKYSASRCVHPGVGTEVHDEVQAADGSADGGADQGDQVDETLLRRHGEET